MSEENNSVEVQVSQEAPAVVDVVVPESGQTEESHVTESVDNTATENASEENVSADTTKETEVESNPDDKQWIGKRLERAKAKAREEAQAEIEYWKRQATQASQPPQQHQSQVAAQTYSQPEPQLSQFSNIEDFISAKTDWRINQVMQQQNQAAQANKVVETYTQRATEFAAKQPDFAETVQSLINEYNDVAPPEFNTICMESVVGPEIAYYVAQNPHVMEKLINLPPHRRAIELGLIEDRFVKKGTSQPKVVVSKAPAPVKSEKGAAVVTHSLEDYAKDASKSQAEYREMRMASKRRR